MNPEDEQKDLGKVTFPDLPIGRIENHDVEKLFSKPFDQSLLQAGDVLLFKDLRSQRLLNPISAYQTLLYPLGEPAAWTHVAIWDGKFIFDMWPRINRRKYQFYDVFTEYKTVRIRRMREAQVDTHKLDSFINSARNDTYMLTDVHIELLLERLAGTNSQIDLPILEAEYICSTFVRRALLIATTKKFFGNISIPTPADFAASTDFVTIGECSSR